MRDEDATPPGNAPALDPATEPSVDTLMAQALEIAARVGRMGNVPVGAVVLQGGRVVARAGNLRETIRDPTAHAEILALREAARNAASWRLEGAIVVVTLEPCAMCAAALVEARVAHVIYAAREPKTGAHVSRSRAFDGTGIRVDEHPAAARASLSLLSAFFAERR